MNTTQKLVMATGWLAAGFFYLAFLGANKLNEQLASEITLNKRNIELANKIVTDEVFRQIVDHYDQ